MRFILVLIVILSFIFQAGCIVRVPYKEINREVRTEDKEKVLTQEDKEKIDSWIKENNLNIYGDSKDTMYTGGTPLFDESTGKTIDRYEYILNNHPKLKEKLNLSIQ